MSIYQTMLGGILYYGSLAIWPVYQLCARRWTRCSWYLALSFVIQACCCFGVAFWMQHLRQVTSDWWMISAAYVILNIIFAIANSVILLRLRTSSRSGSLQQT